MSSLRARCPAGLNVVPLAWRGRRMNDLLIAVPIVLALAAMRAGFQERTPSAPGARSNRRATGPSAVLPEYRTGAARTDRRESVAKSRHLFRAKLRGANSVRDVSAIRFRPHALTAQRLSSPSSTLRLRPRVIVEAARGDSWGLRLLPPPSSQRDARTANTAPCRERGRCRLDAKPWMTENFAVLVGSANARQPATRNKGITT